MKRALYGVMFVLAITDCRSADLVADPVIHQVITNMVSIPGKNYRIGKTEVTQAQWEAVMGENPSSFKGTNLPVERVSWNDCQEYVKKLNERPEVKASGLHFRLPTEEEWEYACRAGGKGDWGKRANGQEGSIDLMGWYWDNSGNRTHPVGTKDPNAFGLYDMHGNVWEWTSAADGGSRVRRGGSWSCISEYCMAGNRFGYIPDSDTSTSASALQPPRIDEPRQKDSLRWSAVRPGVSLGLESIQSL